MFEQVAPQSESAAHGRELLFAHRLHWALLVQVWAVPLHRDEPFPFPQMCPMAQSESVLHGSLVPLHTSSDDAYW